MFRNMLVLRIFAVLSGLCLVVAANAAQPGAGVGLGNQTALSGGAVLNPNYYNQIIQGQRTAALAGMVCDRFEECSRYIDRAALATGVVRAMDGGQEMVRCTTAINNCFVESGVNYRNCESLIKRCAQPRCSNGGCADVAVAGGIVNGCIQGLQPAMALGCQQFPALVNAIGAELVASSAATQQQAAAAAQQAAAAQAAQQNDAQVQAMQQQMLQMQQEMAAAQAASAAQVQEALAAATAAAQAPAPVAQPEVLHRETAAGQIVSELDKVTAALAVVQKAMTTLFDYAGCDYRGENCGEIRRIAAFREKANQFFQPFDDAIDSIFNAVSYAEALGVDMSNVYMFMEGSCNQWGLYRDCGTQAARSTYYSPQKCKNGNLDEGPIRLLGSGEQVYMEFSMGTKRDDGLFVACASQNAVRQGAFARRRASAAEIDPEPLRIALSVVDNRNSTLNLCCSSAGSNGPIFPRNTDIDNMVLEKANTNYLLCPIHQNNRNESSSTNSGVCSSYIPDKELITRRATNITKEMNSQYTKLETIANQIKTMTQKATLTHDQQVAEEAGGGASSISSAASMCISSMDTYDMILCMLGEANGLIQNASGTISADMLAKCKVLSDFARATNPVSSLSNNVQATKSLADAKGRLPDKCSNSRTTFNSQMMNIRGVLMSLSDASKPAGSSAVRVSTK